MRLTATPKLLMIFSIVLLLASCQKEVGFNSPVTNTGGSGGTGGTGNNTSIIGNWDFVGMLAHTLSTVTADQLGTQLKSVTTSDYITKNNTGTVQITSTQFISNGLAYSIDTTMNVKTYVNGALLDDSDFPFVISSPASSSTSTYVRNSTDSMTVTGSLGVPDPSGNTATGPAGFKISWSGDTLILKTATTYSQTITQGGIPGNFVGTVTGTMKLKRH